MHFHCVRHVLRCRGHRGRRRGISVGKPPHLSGLVLPVTLDWTRQMLELRPRSIGWDGSVISSWTHWPSSLPIWRPASSAKAFVDDILLLSPSISRYCYLWFGQPQLLSNATSGHGFHATASRLSQLVPSRSLSSDAHSRTVQSSLQLRSLDQTTTWRGIGGAVVQDALATRLVELWSATHWPPLCPQAHRRSRTAEGPPQRGHLLTGVRARQQAVGNTTVATPGSVSRLDTAGVQNKGAAPRTAQETGLEKLCSCLRFPAAPCAAFCVLCRWFCFPVRFCCPCLPFCAGRWVVSTVRVFPSLCFTGADPRTEPWDRYLPIRRVPERYVRLLGLYWVRQSLFIHLFPFRCGSLEPLGLERTSDRITSDLYVQRASRRGIRSSRSFQNSERLDQ